MYTPTKGRIIFNGRELQGQRPDKIAACGIARTFQNIRLFHGMSVLENVLTACNLRENPGLFESVFHLPSYRVLEKDARNKSLALLDSVGLAPYADSEAAALPYGMQRRLEIVRALATEPKLLLLDEPAAGMNPQESAELMEFILHIREQYEIAVLLIEHHMQVVMGICERLYVLDYGVTIAEGTPEEIRGNKKVIDAYLGMEGGDA
jgi:branched-chain amino acid transport system ATP-binding protein